MVGDEAQNLQFLVPQRGMFGFHFHLSLSLRNGSVFTTTVVIRKIAEYYIGSQILFLRSASRSVSVAGCFIVGKERGDGMSLDGAPIRFKRVEKEQSPAQIAAGEVAAVERSDP
jgi:hypothetical protein